jgi:pyruvate dehydrogenase E2 component (dihydrolipoamide acetyltransferase)
LDAFSGERSSPAPPEHAHATRVGERRALRRRRVAAASWRAPSAGLIHGFLDLDVTDAEAWWQELPGVTATHVAGCAVAQAIAVCPDARGLVVAGRVRTRPTVDVSFVVDRDGTDLSSVCVRDADTLDPPGLAAALTRPVRETRAGRDRQLGRATSIVGTAPSPLRRAFLFLAGLWTSGFGRALTPARLEAHPFGSVIVSSVGMLGLDTGLAPVLPYARNAGTVVVGEVTWQPRVIGMEVVPRRLLRLGVTLDHRLVDGAQAALLARVVRSAVERPWQTWGGEPPFGALASVELYDALELV